MPSTQVSISRGTQDCSWLCTEEEEEEEMRSIICSKVAWRTRGIIILTQKDNCTQCALKHMWKAKPVDPNSARCSLEMAVGWTKEVGLDESTLQACTEQSR